MHPLSLRVINTNVYSVHLPDGAHVGNLKHIGNIWKFKAVGYEPDGAVLPGGGPFTDSHNMAFETPDAAEINARLACTTRPEATP